MKGFFYTIWYCQREVWRTNKLYYFLYYVGTFPIAFVGIIWTVITKDLIDLIVLHTTTHSTFDISELRNIALLACCWILILWICQTIQRFMEDRLERTYSLQYEKQLIAKIDNLDIQHFEDSKFLDLLHNVRGNEGKILNVFKSSSRLVRDLAQGVTVLSFLTVINPIIPIVIIIVEGAFIFQRSKQNIAERNLDKEITPEKRRAGQYFGYFLAKVPVEEMKLYNLRNHFKQKVIEVEGSVIKQFNHLRDSYLPSVAILHIVQMIFVNLAPRFYIFLQAIGGKLTVGEFSFYFSQIGIFENAISAIGQDIRDIYKNILYIKYTYELNEIIPVLDYSKSKKIIKGIDSIEFKNITFGYPGNGEKRVFNNFNLTINAGEKIALVGLNGAGKTTLIKLLLRYYDPLEGEILINGINLKNVNLISWYENVGVLFQDFMKYEVSVADNVGYGKINKIEKQRPIKDSLEKASANTFVNEYPDKLNQTLGRQYENSIQPSGGQWQKIALARAFFRDAPLLILDEPTASIDAQAEAEIFEKVERLSKDKTVIIISHRFSTVRNADRIIVIDQGNIIEQGSHKDLLHIKGKYAELFELQAREYK